MKDIYSFLQKIKVFLNYSNKDKKRNNSKKKSSYKIRKTTYIIIGSFFIVGLISVSDTIDKITIQLNAEAAQNYIEQDQSPINVSAKVKNNLFLYPEVTSNILRTNLIADIEKNTIEQDSDFTKANETFLLAGLLLGTASNEFLHSNFDEQSILTQNEIQETIEVFSKEKGEIKINNLISEKQPLIVSLASKETVVSNKTQKVKTEEIKQDLEQQNLQKAVKSEQSKTQKTATETTKQDSNKKETKQETTEEVKQRKKSAQQEQKVGQGFILTKKYNANMDCSLSKSDLAVLQRIVEAEAPEEDIYGKMLVANVVLNRVFTKEFPNTVEKVVFQKGQFSPIRDGRYWKVSISASTVEAVNRVLSGEDYSDGALYFFARRWTSTKKASWFDNSLKRLFKYGGHEFYKNK